MMTEVFGDTDPQTTDTGSTTTPPAPSPTIPDGLKEFVGEGKKYATLEAALSSIAPAQSHIQRLEDELKALREGQTNKEALDETYKAVQEMLDQLKDNPPSSGMDEAAIAGLLDRQLTAREQKQLAVANAGIVKEALTKKYGDKAKEIYNAKAVELGINDGFFNDLASKSPKAVLELFGIKPTSSATPTRPGSVNTEQFNHAPPAPPKKNIMFGATQADIMEAWNRHKPKE